MVGEEMRYLLLTLLLFVGCSSSTPLTNDQIIAETKKCEMANMRTTIWYGGLSGMPIKVFCLPKEK